MCFMKVCSEMEDLTGRLQTWIFFQTEILKIYFKPLCSGGEEKLFPKKL